MFNDIHTHITYEQFPSLTALTPAQKPFRVKELLYRMDRENIERAVVLPLVSPEVIDTYGVTGNQETIECVRMHPDRLIAFCYVDPRSLLAHGERGFGDILELYRELGCRGIGEMTASIPIDDWRYQRLFHAAGELRMPILFHFTTFQSVTYGAIDDLGLPRLEKMLQLFPRTEFIGHSQTFWNEMDAELVEERRDVYNYGSIIRRGRLWELFANYPNLRADISSGSGYLALTRDPDGYEFLETFQAQLYFGTDRFTDVDEPEPPIISFLEKGLGEGRLSRNAFDRIAYQNFNQTFGIR